MVSHGSRILSAPSKPPSRPSAAGTLRELLRETHPEDFSLKLAWRQLIRALRARKREVGVSSRFDSRGAIEKALDAPLRTGLDAEDEAVLRLKQALRSLVVAPEPQAGRGPPPDPGSAEMRSLAHRIDGLLETLLPVVASGPVTVSVEGWPRDFASAQRARLLRWDHEGPMDLSPIEAAAAVREWDGFVLGGSALRVQVSLAPDTVLPTVPRSLRARPLVRDQRSTWLDHVDDEGKRSLTPRAIAERFAGRVTTQWVIDGCCGCGGNAIAFAASGLQVVALDVAPGRLELARKNARQWGVEERIRFVEGDVVALLPDLLSDLPNATVFLDPPWAESLADREMPSWSDLLPGGQALAKLLTPEHPVLAKLPRSFDLDSLPGANWEVCYEFGEGSMASVVRMIRAWRPASGHSPVDAHAR